MRKGADLLAQVIAPVCARLPHAHFLIAGDGRKRALIEEVRDVHQLGDRVTLLGKIGHTEVPDLLARAHLFLNCSLTEAFCMAILEAASCGCYVVSTNVGGIPGFERIRCVFCLLAHLFFSLFFAEVLPPDMITMAQPSADALIEAIVASVPRLASVDAMDFHARIAAAYDWNTVTDETLEVYRTLQAPSFAQVMHEFQRRAGAVFGKVWCLLFLLDLLLLRVLRWFQPDEDIEPAAPYGPPMKKT